MKLIMLFFASILLTGLLSTNPQEVSSPSAQPLVYEEAWLRQRAEQLIEKAEKILYRRSITPEDEQAYFEAFPDSFALFEALFSFQSLGTDQRYYLYSRAFLEKVINSYEQYNAHDPLSDYVDALFNLRSIDRTTLYNRIIDLSQGDPNACWRDPFEINQYNLVCKDLEHFCRLLAVRSDEVIERFWRSLSQCPFSIKYLHTMASQLQQVDARVYRLLEKVFEEMCR